MEGECFVCHRYSKGHTGFNLNSTGLPSAWLPSHIEKGDTRLFLWQTHAGSPGSNTGRMHDWPGSQTRYQSAMSPSFWRVYHILSAGIPANTTRWNNDLLMLTQRLRRWSNIRTSLFQRVVFAGITTSTTKKTRYNEPMLVYCWASFVDAGPTISQHWFIVSCLLGRIKLTSKSYREWYYWQCVQPYTQTLLKVVTELFVMYKRRRPYSRIFCCDDITLYIIRYTLYLFRWCLFITLSFWHCTYFTTITQIIIIHHKILIFLHMTVCILPNTVNWIKQIWILATLTFFVI